MSEQLELFGEPPEKNTEAQDKARARKAEAEEFKDKRTPKSKMIAEAQKR